MTTYLSFLLLFFFFFNQKTAYEMRISDWSSDVCSSDLAITPPNEFPFDHSIAANGTLPIEPMKVKKATIGATAAFSSTARKARPCPQPAPMKRVSQKTGGTKTEMNAATVKPKRIAFQTIFQRSEEQTSELQ